MWKVKTRVPFGEGYRFQSLINLGGKGVNREGNKPVKGGGEAVD